MTRLAIEHLDARAQAAAQIREEHRLGERPAADGAAYQVPLLVQHGHVRRAVVGGRVRPDGSGHDLRCGASGFLGETPGIAGRPLLWIRALGINFTRADGGVFLGEQAVHRHRGEIGVTVEGLPVAEAQLQGLGHRVDVRRAVVAHRLEVEVLQDVQRLHEHGPLGPGVLSPDLVAVEGGGHRLAELRVVSGQVVHRQDAAHLPHLVDDQFRDGSLVKRVPRRLQAVLSRAGRRERCVAHGLQRVGQARLPHHCARSGNLPVLVKHFPASRREVVELLLARWRAQPLEHVLVVRNAVLSVTDGRISHLRKRHRSVLVQHIDKCVHDARLCERKRRVLARPGGDAFVPPGPVELRRGLSRRSALARE